MRFIETAIEGVTIVEGTPAQDARGGFERSYCAAAFADAGLPALGVQCNLSDNARRGTLRGLHYQASPAPDPKLVRCLRGRLFDVAVDLRPGSTTRGRWVGLTLDAGDSRALFVPAGCAHGFLTLADDTAVFYMMGAPYDPALARGVRWDDPEIGVDWPFPPVALSARDAALPLLRDLGDEAAR